MTFEVPTDGKYRIVRKFAIFPIKARYTIKWLEVCYVEQRYSEFCYWKNISFLTKEKYENYRKRRESEE